jgi:hypothetical protein
MASEAEFEIPPHLEFIYIISLLFCTESALSSAACISELVKQHKGGRYEFAPQPALNELQNITLQAAAISRYFWPADSKYRGRGDFLRKAFGILDDSPLRSRTLRNRMEHFDEYLDDYFKTVFAGQFIPDYFGIKPPADRGPLHFFRAFFTNTGEFEILGQIFKIQPLVDEIDRIHTMLLECDK